MATVRGVSRRAEVVEQFNIRLRKGVEVEEILAGRHIDELAFKDERAAAAEVGIEVKAVLEMGWQTLEVGAAGRLRDRHARWQFRQTARDAEGMGLPAGRIAQDHAVEGGAAVGDGIRPRLLVGDLRAGLATHLGQAAGGQHQGLGRGQHRYGCGLGAEDRVVRPLRIVRQRGGEPGHLVLARSRGDVRHDRADGRLRLKADAGNEEARHAFVIIPHAVGRRVTLLVGTTVEPVHALAIDKGEAVVIDGNRTSHGGRRARGIVRHQDDLAVFHRVGVVLIHQRQRQECQWHRCLDRSARGLVPRERVRVV